MREAGADFFHHRVAEGLEDEPLINHRVRLGALAVARHAEVRRV
jgi:hypothetical protein